MLSPGDRVGVAVSGGPDSVCLLNVLRHFAPLRGVTLSVVHLNHQLRGSASDEDARFVAALAQAHGLPFHCATQSVGPSEDDARQARLAYFASLRETGLVDRIATGHTLDDQAETVLFRLLRGASPSGLEGILPATREGLIRPLLDVSRTEVCAYLRDNGFVWRIDSSNADPRFARNRIRHYLLPSLIRDWNPSLPAQLARLANIARDEDRFLSALVPPPFTDGHAVLIPTTPIDNALRRRQVRWAVEHLGGKQLDFRHVEAMVALFAPQLGSGRLQTPGIDVMRSFDWVRFVRLAAAGNRNWSQPLPVPGFVSLPSGGITASLGTIEGDCFDCEATGPGLTVRNWHPGDAYLPTGTLKQRFEAERIPLWERRNWPIITTGSEIVWSKSFGVADRFRVAAGGRSCRIQLSERQLVPLSGRE